MHTFYGCIQYFQMFTQILSGYVHYSELCFLMSITWKGFGQFREIANVFYTICSPGDNSNPRVANTLCIKKADVAPTCINLICSALSQSANTLCPLRKIKQQPQKREKQDFFEPREAAFTLKVQRVRVCGRS